MSAGKGPERVYEALRKRWRAYLLGGSGEDLDLSSPAVAAYIEGLNGRANRCWSGLAQGGRGQGRVFPDLDMTDGVSDAYTRSGNMGCSLQRLAVLSTAWAVKGCGLYHNGGVLNQIIKAADYVVSHFFRKGRFAGRSAYGNWYHWEIACPTALGNIAMVLYDQLGADRVRLYAEAIQYYAPYCTRGGPRSNGPAMTGGNLLLKANGVAQAGILLEDPSMLDNVRAGVKGAMGYNSPGRLFALGDGEDGFYADGSYIQHQGLPYIAGYGTDLYYNYGILAHTLRGTDWDVTPSGGETALICDFVFNGIEPFIAGGRAMDMVSGRDITRKGRSDRARTANILCALLGMRGSFPTVEQNQRFDRMMKFFLSREEDGYCRRMDSAASARIAGALMADSGVKPRSGYALTKTFAMDRTVHHTAGFTLGIAMHSTRTFAHELINGEGKRTWYIANGMVFLYDKDEDQYGGGYWCTVDPTRLPGITAEHIVPADGQGDRNANLFDWTGGCAVGGSGAAGMHMRALSRYDRTLPFQSGPRTGADMKKSWFMFGDRVLMLGSSITSETPDHVETIVENRRIRPDGSNAVTVDGAAVNLSTNPAEPTVLKNPAWMHLEGSVPGADIGWCFPQSITLQAMKDTRTGDWSAQGADSGTAVNTFATFYVDHGVKPAGAGYAYILLPGRSAAETAAYAAQPDVEILRADGAVHAARDNSQGVLAANFWLAGAVEDIRVSAPASVVVKREGDMMTIGVSDPTQRDVSITVTVAAAGGLAAKDSTVSVDCVSPFVRFTVDTTGSLGAAHTAAFRMD